MPKLYFITGISGSGKTTIGRKLMESGEVVFDSKIQKGLFHFVDKYGNEPVGQNLQDAKWRAEHRWVLNKPLLGELMSKHSSVLRVFLCGGADDIEQYWPLGEKVFLLCIDEKTLYARLNSADRDNGFAKDDATQRLLAERLDRLQKRRIASGAISIDATGSIDEVVAEILGMCV